MSAENTIPQDLIYELAVRLYFSRRLHFPISREQFGGKTYWREDIVEWREMPPAQKNDWIKKAERFLTAWFAKYPTHVEFVTSNMQRIYTE